MEKDFTRENKKLIKYDYVKLKHLQINLRNQKKAIHKRRDKIVKKLQVKK